MSFSTLRPRLTKFHAGSEQPLVCVVMNRGAKQKLGGHGPSRPPLIIATAKNCWRSVIYSNGVITSDVAESYLLSFKPCESESSQGYLKILSSQVVPNVISALL